LDGDTDLGEWAGKVDQYVLGLDVFKKPDYDGKRNSPLVSLILPSPNEP
jgi:hypothetical protein